VRRRARAGRALLVRRGDTKSLDYAIREAGMIESSPQKIIAQGTDWRFLNELKKELNG
jgi:hypothetical protein